MHCFHFNRYGCLRFVVPFIKIQLYIEDYNKNIPEGEQQIRSFTVIPQHNFGRISITMDKTVVTEIYNLSAFPTMHETTPAPVAWDHCFDLSKLRRKTMDNFSFLMRTNGVKASVVIDKPIGAIEFDSDDDVGSDWDEISIDVDSVDLANESEELDVARIRHQRGIFQRYVGIDWGSEYPIAYTCVENVDGVNKETTGYLRPEEYYKAINHEKYNKDLNQIVGSFKRLERLDQQGVKRRTGYLPSSKSAGFEAYIAHKLRMFTPGTETWLKKDIAVLNFKRYQVKQRVLQDISNCITQGLPTVVRAGENPIKQRSCIKGQPRFPINDLIRTMKNDPLIDLIIGDEYNTTQKCSLCFSQLVFNEMNRKKRNVYCPTCVPRNDILPRATFYRRINVIPGRPNIETPYKQLPPFRPNPKRCFHRDGNASRNITYLLLCSLNEREPDGVFVRRT